MPKKLLTCEQLPAATSKATLTFVDAAPGSGKTFMSVERFGWLRYHHLADDPRAVAGVSYARSASAEFRSRVATRWGTQALSWPSFIVTFDELLRMVFRHLLATGEIRWPNAHVCLEVHDTWRRFPNTKLQGAKHKPLRVFVNVAGEVTVGPLGTWPKPKAYFVDEAQYLEQLGKGVCTHDEIRSALHAVLIDRSPDLSSSVADYLRRSLAHLLVDEVFDLNHLDVCVLEILIEAGVPLTVVGDPWQSIFTWRGSTPKLVRELVDAPSFQRFPVTGSHRYRTTEMKDLSSRLIQGKSFSVFAAEALRRPSVVIADTWRALWGTDSLPVLPCGFGRLDSSVGSAALITLLNDFTVELDANAADYRNALNALGFIPDRRQFGLAREAISDPGVSIEEVWKALHEGLGKPKVWGKPKDTAGESLLILINRIRTKTDDFILGTSTHQSKGLEWAAVDYVTELKPNIHHLLDQDKESDRRKYVALTRAKDSVRVRPLPPKVALQLKYLK